GSDGIDRCAHLISHVTFQSSQRSSHRTALVGMRMTLSRSRADERSFVAGLIDCASSHLKCVVQFCNTGLTICCVPAGALTPNPQAHNMALSFRMNHSHGSCNGGCVGSLTWRVRMQRAPRGINAICR